MKTSPVSCLFAVIAVLTVYPAISQADQQLYSPEDLRQCISYYETIQEKKGNVQKLERIMDEIDEKISDYDRKINNLEGEIQYSSGSRRSSLIDQYDYLLAKRNDYSDLYNQALDKQQLRISQHDKTIKRYKNECFGKSAKIADLDLVCPERKGYCSEFK